MPCVQYSKREHPSTHRDSGAPLTPRTSTPHAARSLDRQQRMLSEITATTVLFGARTHVLYVGRAWRGAVGRAISP